MSRKERNMMSMLCNIWNDFSAWVFSWSQLTYIFVVCIFAILGLFGLLAFFKKSVNKDKRPKWGMLIISIIMFALLAVVVAARPF